MLLLLLGIYVLVAVALFAGFAAYFAKQGVGMGALPLTALLWPIVLPLFVLGTIPIALSRFLGRLGSGRVSNRDDRRVMAAMGDLDRALDKVGENTEETTEESIAAIEKEALAELEDAEKD